ncbi:MAG: phosphoglycerate dehydrogenase [Firmicutes bacterium]|nr:phosphoglycerate dehydrogenase [Bacillota bacterium]
MEGAKQYKVLVSDPVSEKGIQLLNDIAQVDVKPDLSAEEIIDTIGDYDALLVRSGTKVTAEVIAAGEKLKVIGRAGVGVDNIDVEKATEQGVLVLNAPDGNTISAAEHTMALMLALARNIPPASSSLKAGQWQRNKFVGLELYKKCLGVIGLGRIGSEVAKRARAFGMRILAYDPYISAEQAEKIGVVACQNLVEILPQADFITVHVPRTSSTEHLLGAKELAKMKDGVRIINCARGGLIDEKALYEAITAGKVAGAALDVFEKEPPANNNPLLQLEQVISTPHLGASTQEAQINVAVQVAEEIMHVLKGEPLHMAVNAPVLPPKLMSEIEPFVPLMKILGNFYMQIFNGRIENIEITYSGSIAEYPVTSLTTALLIGFLRVMLNSNVNFVNAPLIAEQRGIKVQEITSKGDSIFNNLISVKVTADGKTSSVAGTIFGRNDIRIVQIGDYRIEVVPSRFMLVCKYTDKPGVIGKVGTILGNNGINIAGMQVGRREIGGEAIMVLQVDNHVQEKMLEELKTVEHILSAKAVEIKPYFSESAI